MKRLLVTFNNDKHTKNAVKDYILGHLEATTIKKVMAREDVSGIADAKEILIGAFKSIEREFGVKEEKQALNEAE